MSMDTGHVSIAVASKETGLTHRALRFYEGRGLVSPDYVGGQRFYTIDHIAKLKRITQLTRYGFTLAEILKGVTARDMVKQHGELVMKIEDLAKAAVELQGEIESDMARQELIRRG